jgi:hypothetical protein
MAEKQENSEFDGRTKFGRRYAAIAKELTAEHEPGDARSLSVQLRIATAAALAARLELARADAASGHTLDPAALAQLATLATEAIRAARPLP